MYAAAVKPKNKNKSRAVANSVGQKRSELGQGFVFVDNRPETIIQNQMQEKANDSPHVNQTEQVKLTMKDTSIIQGRFVYDNGKSMSTNAYDQIVELWRHNRGFGAFTTQWASEDVVDFFVWISTAEVSDELYDQIVTIASEDYGRVETEEEDISDVESLTESEGEYTRGNRLDNIDNAIRSTIKHLAKKDTSGHGKGKRISKGHTSDKHQKGQKRKTTRKTKLTEDVENLLREYKEAGGSIDMLKKSTKKLLKNAGFGLKQIKQFL